MGIKNIMILWLMLVSFMAIAQKVDYTNNVISLDGKDLCKVVKIKDKQNFGITSSYEIHSLTGKKLIIATLASEFAEARNDNSNYYYRFTFLTANQVGIFPLAKLGTEKSFAKLIGQSGIVANDSIDNAKLVEFIALRSSNPRKAVDYRLVKRNYTYAVMVKENNIIKQGNVIIGGYRDVTKRPDVDVYEFTLPEGLIIAKVSFTGGNNARNCTITTSKDSFTRTVAIPADGKYNIVSSIDRNVMALERIAKWLVEHDYL